MKLYIVGSVASGKSTLAEKISKITKVQHYHLDEVVYIKDATQPCGNRKRSNEERDKIFYNILKQNNYIMEDAGRKCFVKGMQKADVTILLEPHRIVRRKRILFRWIKQNLGIEKCIYKPNFDMLKAMLLWAKNYDTGIDGTKERVVTFSNKLLLLRNNKDINRYLEVLKTGDDGKS